MHLDTAAAIAALPHDLTPWAMYRNATLIVQTVMIGLALASLATWTVLLAKLWELRGERRLLLQARGVLVMAHHLGQALDDPAMADGICKAMAESAGTELQLSRGIEDRSGVKERVGSRLERLEIAQARRLRRGTGILATIGAVAPFVGLFGTVWGIMNSFIGIAQSNTTNLAVVAPGIAEALLATALGLVAAIPAVVIYNHLSRSLAGLRDLAGDVSSGVQLLVSRELDKPGVLRAAA